MNLTLTNPLSKEIAAMFALFDDKKFKVLMEEAGVAVNNIKEAN